MILYLYKEFKGEYKDALTKVGLMQLSGRQRRDVAAELRFASEWHTAATFAIDRHVPNINVKEYRFW